MAKHKFNVEAEELKKFPLMIFLMQLQLLIDLMHRLHRRCH